MSRSEAPTRSRWDVRTIGPALMVVFGLVLLATPMASVGITGSVGNAGVGQKEPEPPVDPEPEPDPDPEPEPQPEPEPEPDPTEPAPEPESDPAPTSPADSGVGPATDEGAPAAAEAQPLTYRGEADGTGAEADQLPLTGPLDDNGTLAAIGGLMLVLGGAALFVAGRRAATSG